MAFQYYRVFFILATLISDLLIKVEDECRKS